MQEDEPGQETKKIPRKTPDCPREIKVPYPLTISLQTLAHGCYSSLLFYVIAQFSYRIIVKAHLEQTSALFIGLPAVLAVLMIMTRPARTATGAMLRGTTIALLMAGPLLGEGFICVLMAAPLFYLVAIIVGFVDDRARRKSKATERNKLRAMVWIPLALMTLEGTSEKLSFPRNETVSVTRTVLGSVNDCENRLAETTGFSGDLPFYLKMGFPQTCRSAWGQSGTR